MNKTKRSSVLDKYCFLMRQKNECFPRGVDTPRRRILRSRALLYLCLLFHFAFVFSSSFLFPSTQLIKIIRCVDQKARKIYAQEVPRTSSSSLSSSVVSSSIFSFLSSNPFFLFILFLLLLLLLFMIVAQPPPPCLAFANVRVLRDRERDKVSSGWINQTSQLVA